MFSFRFHPVLVLVFLMLLGFVTSATGQDIIDPLSPEDSATTAGDAGAAGRRDTTEEDRAKLRRERTLMQFEPSGQVSAEQLPHYIEVFRRGSVYDERLYRFVASAQQVPGTTGTIILTGEVTTPEYSSGLQNTLTLLGFHVQENRIQLLPAKELGEAIYAVATTSSASMRAMARDSSEQVNSVAMGGMMRLLRRAHAEDERIPLIPDARERPRADSVGRGINRPAAPDPGEVPWYLAQSLEGYMGFVRADQIELRNQLDLPDHLLLETTTVTLEGKALVLPAGCYLHVNTSNQLSLKPGGPVVTGQLKTASISKPLLTAAEILSITRSLMGTRYLWGGGTANGIDCSGFTQFLWKSQGHYLPRDAKQQASVGQIVAWGRDVEKAAQPGDLLFFTNGVGRISHVGASLGNGKMIHSGGGGGVHVVKLGDTRGRSGKTYLDGIIFARRIQGQ